MGSVKVFTSKLKPRGKLLDPPGKTSGGREVARVSGRVVGLSVFRYAKEGGLGAGGPSV